MPDYVIAIEPVEVRNERGVCNGGFYKIGGEPILFHRAIPAGMCARAFSVIYPVALAMRFSEEISFQKGKDYVDVTCPDAEVTFRLRRVKKD